jgi:TrpR family transcriptional regulator, trp operon repressor
MEYNDADVERQMRELSVTLADTDDPGLIEEFLRSLLTPYEVWEIATRWALVRLIEQGVSQRNISKQLGLSLCKITRGSRELKKDDSAFAEMIERFKRIQSKLE